MVEYKTLTLRAANPPANDRLGEKGYYAYVLIMEYWSRQRYYIQVENGSIR